LSPLLYAWNATNDIFTFAAGCSRQGGHPKTNVTPEHPDQKVAHSFLCPWHWVFRGTLAFFRRPQFGMSSRIFFNSTMTLSTSDDDFPTWSADNFLLPANAPAV